MDENFLNMNRRLSPWAAALLLALWPNWAAFGQYLPLDLGFQGLTKCDLEWADIDNDGDLDLLAMGSFLDYELKKTLRSTQVLLNLGGRAFAPSPDSLPGLDQGDMALADFDRDGDLDLLISGFDGQAPRAFLFENKGGRFFASGQAIEPLVDCQWAWADLDNDAWPDLVGVGTGKDEQPRALLYLNRGGRLEASPNRIPPLSRAGLAAADHDRDGDMDLALIGASLSGDRATEQAWLLRNDGGALLTPIDLGLPGYSDGDLSWGDFDADGYPDLFLCGSEDFSPPTLMRNAGGKLQATDAQFPGVNMAASAWADFDSDGDLDLFLMGFAAQQGSRPITEIHENLGQGRFQPSRERLRSLWLGTAKPADFDRDGDVDLAIAGFNEQFHTLLFQNARDLPNRPPAAPSGLSVSILPDSSSAILRWRPSANEAAPDGASTYELYFSERSLQHPDSAWPGALRLPLEGFLGKLGADTAWLARGLEVGKGYHWSVRAVDNTGARSQLAYQNSFMVGFQVQAKASDTQVCVGQAVRFENFSSFANEFLWKRDGIIFATTRNASYSFSQPGSYDISLTALNGTFAQTEHLRVDVHELPRPEILSDRELDFCEGEQATLRASLPGMARYQWTLNGEPLEQDQPSIVASQWGRYGLAVEDRNGCAAQALPVSLIVHPSPDAQVRSNSPNPICQGEQARLMAEAGVGTSRQWLLDGQPIEGATGSDLAATRPGRYSARITNSYGCATTTEPYSLIVNPLPEFHIDKPSLEFCQGNSSTLSTGADPASAFVWYRDEIALPTDNLPLLQVSQPGRYKSRITNNLGCHVFTPEVRVQVHPRPAAPSIAASGATSFCQGGAVLLASADTQRVSFRWTVYYQPIENAQGLSLEAVSSGNYRLVATNVHECSASSNAIAVRVYEMPQASVSPQGPVLLCQGNELWLEASTQPGVSYQWMRNGRDVGPSNQARLRVEREGEYQLEASTQYCQNLSAPVQASFAELPSAEPLVPSVVPLCSGGAARLELRATPGASYAWYQGQRLAQEGSSPVFEATEPGEYTCRVSSSATCAASSLAISVRAVRVEFSYQNECEENTVSFVSRVSGGVEGGQISWQMGSRSMEGVASPKVRFNEPGPVPVRLSVDFGGICQEQAEREVEVLPTPKMQLAANNAIVGRPSEFGFSTLIHPEAIASFHWDFGDGEWLDTEDAASVSHVYQKEGNPAVKVTARLRQEGCPDLEASKTILVSD